MFTVTYEQIYALHTVLAKCQLNIITVVHVVFFYIFIITELQLLYYCVSICVYVSDTCYKYSLTLKYYLHTLIKFWVLNKDYKSELSNCYEEITLSYKNSVYVHIHIHVVFLNLIAYILAVVHSIFQHASLLFFTGVTEFSQIHSFPSKPQ